MFSSIYFTTNSRRNFSYYPFFEKSSALQVICLMLGYGSSFFFVSLKKFSAVYTV